MGAAPGKTSATGADDKPSTVIGRITWSVVSMLRVTMPAPGLDQHQIVADGYQEDICGRFSQSGNGIRSYDRLRPSGIAGCADAGHDVTGRQPRQPSPTLLVCTGLGDHRRRGDSRQKRAADGGAAQLLEHDRQLGQSVPLATELRIDVQAEPSCGDDLLPQAVV